MADNWIDKIDDYFDNLLSTEERAAFEKALEFDDQLKLEVELYRDTVAILDAAAEADVLSEVKEIYANEFPQKELPKAQDKDGAEPILRNSIPKRSNPFGLLLKIAAVLLVFGLGYFTYQYFTPGPDSSELYTEYFDSFKDDDTSGGELDTQAFWDGIAQYNQADYLAAIEFFEQVPTTSSKYSKALLYHGLSAMQVGQHKESIKLFTDLAADTDLAEIASWYKSLSFLATDQSSEAVEQLTIHINSNYKFKRQSAKRLLDALK